MKNPNASGTSRTERLLPDPKSDPWFGVSEIACQLSAQKLTLLKDSNPSLGSPWSGRDLTEKFFFISICHQYNWNELESAMSKLFAGCKSATQITNLVRDITPEQFEQPFGEGIDETRIRSNERIGILKETAKILESKFKCSLQSLLSKSKKRLSGPKGLYSYLDEFPAFEADPLRKKSCVLVHELVRNGNIAITDPENIKPAIDYHIIRIYLRSGRIFPKHKLALERLTSHKNQPSRVFVEEARRATAQALGCVAQFSNLSIAHVNYVEWMLARSQCIRSSPLCRSKLDVDKAANLEPLKQEKCCFNDFCAVNWLDDWEEVWEPIFDSTHY